MEPKRIVINTETGEQEGEMIEGDKIIRKSSLESFRGGSTIEGDFLKLLSCQILPMLENCKDKRGKIKYENITLIFYLMNFISYKSGVLQHPNGKKLTVSYMIKDPILNMDQTSIYERVKDLQLAKIIVPVEIDGERCFVFNPYIAHKGARVDNTHLHLFTDVV